MVAQNVMTTRRLVLRPVVASDADAVWRIHSDPATNAHNPAGPMRERSEATALAQEWAEDWDRDGIGYWALERTDHRGEVIGFGGVRRSRWHDREICNLYYRLAPSAWGQGFASELADAAVRKWRALPERPPLIARTTEDNRASQKTALRAGLQRCPELDETADGVVDVVFGLGAERFSRAHERRSRPTDTGLPSGHRDAR